MYEHDTAAINCYNATLTTDGNFATLQRAGPRLVPTDNAQKYRLFEFITNGERIWMC
jgi:hypothetical protein